MAAEEAALEEGRRRAALERREQEKERRPAEVEAKRLDDARRAERQREPVYSNSAAPQHLQHFK